MSIWPLRQGLSLRMSLLLFILLPLIVTLSVSGYYSLLRLEQSTEQRMQEDIELIARTLRGPVEYSLELGREGSIAQALASAFQFGRVYGAYVYNSQGQRIASSGPSAPTLRGRDLAELAAGSDQIGEYQESAGQQVYSYFVPLTDSIGQNRGLLQVTREGRDIDAYIDGVQRQALLLLVALSLLLFAILVYGHHRVFGRNLQKLVNSMSRIGQGDTQHRAEQSGPREIRQLADGMNSMLNNIERARLRLDEQQQQQQQLEQQLHQSKKMAAVGQLAAGVAHELGTPLSVVSGKAQRILRNPALDDSVRQVFMEIRDAVQRMEHIVRQLLDFGRSNPLRLRRLSLDRVAQSALLQVQDEAEQQGVQIQLEGETPAPTLSLDAVRFEQALVNLLRNAIQASAEITDSSRDKTVTLRWFRSAKQCGFQVADNGPGIADDLREHICEPFFTTKSVGKGTGLGMSVTRSVVDEHGGKLEIGTAASGGAMFSLLFDAEEDESNE